MVSWFALVEGFQPSESLFQKQTVGRVGGAVPPYRDQKYHATKRFPENLWSRYAPRLTLGATRPPELARNLKLSAHQEALDKSHCLEETCAT